MTSQRQYPRQGQCVHCNDWVWVDGDTDECLRCGGCYYDSKRPPPKRERPEKDNETADLFGEEAA